MGRGILVCTILASGLAMGGKAGATPDKCIENVDAAHQAMRDTITPHDTVQLPHDQLSPTQDSLPKPALDTSGFRTVTIVEKDTIYPQAPAKPDPLFIGNDTTICPGTVLWLHAGAGFQHYAWSTGDTAESIIAGPGRYRVIVSDSVSQRISNTRTIKASPRPEVGITASPIDCRHASATLVLHPDGGAGAPFAFALEGGAFTRDPRFPGMAPGDYVFRVRDSLGCLSAAETFTVNGFPERTLITSAIASGVRCPGGDDGSIQVNIDHGDPPFTFSLDGQAPRTNGVFSHIFSGPHVIVVQSDFCADTLNVNVSGRPPLHFSPAVSDETAMHNGRIALHPGGGTPPYAVSWEQAPLKDTVAEHLPAATYTVHLKDSFGCPADTSIVIRGRIPAAVPVLAENKSKKKRKK